MVNEQPSIERRAALALQAECLGKIQKIQDSLRSGDLFGRSDATWGEVSWWIDVYSDLEDLAEKVG